MVPLARLAFVLREALRSLARARRQATASVCLVAAGLGSTLAIAAALDAVLLQPLPFADPDRLVRIFEVQRAAGIRTDVSAHTAAEWMNRASSFEALAAVGRISSGAVLTSETSSRTVQAAYATWNYFDVLGVRPLRGRTFTGEFPDGILISHRLWQSLGSPEDLIGASLILDGGRWQVVGVMPAGITYPGVTDVWFTAPYVFPRRGEWRGSGDRGERTFELIGRLKPGVTVDRAEAEVQYLASRTALEQAVTNAGWTAILQLLDEAFRAPWRPRRAVGARELPVWRNQVQGNIGVERNAPPSLDLHTSCGEKREPSLGPCHGLLCRHGAAAAP